MTVAWDETGLYPENEEMFTRELFEGALQPNDLDIQMTDFAPDPRYPHAYAATLHVPEGKNRNLRILFQRIAEQGVTVVNDSVLALSLPSANYRSIDLI